MSFSRDSQAPSSIPKITDLRLQLGYGDSQLERCRAFYNDVTAFRRKHCTSAGLSGTELLDWKSPEHQSALDQMVHIYLDRQGNGYHYWPPHDHFPSLTDLQYDQDRSLIKSLMKQLLFRLNQQQFRNAKYKKKTQALPDHRSDICHDNKTTVEPDAYEAVAMPVARMVPEADVAGVPKISATPTDIFEVPLSPPTDRTLVRSSKQRRITTLHLVKDQNKSAFAHNSATSKHSRPQDHATESKAKRPRLQILTAKDDNNSLPKNNESVPAIRCSPRVRRSVHRPYIATEAEILEAVAPRSPSPSAGLQDIVNQSDIVAEDMEGHGLATPLSTLQAHIEDPNSAGPIRDTVEAIDSTPLPCRLQSIDQPKVSFPKPAQSDPLPPTVPSKIATKPNIKFIYHVILSRSPTYQDRTWQPRGKFLEKTLSVLLQELPFQNTLTLDFCLAGPGLKVDAQIESTDEPAFDAMKKRWNKQIRMCLSKHDDMLQPLIMEIEIGPTKEEEEDIGDHDEIEALDW